MTPEELVRVLHHDEVRMVLAAYLGRSFSCSTMPTDPVDCAMAINEVLLRFVDTKEDLLAKSYETLMGERGNDAEDLDSGPMPASLSDVHFPVDVPMPAGTKPPAGPADDRFLYGIWWVPDGDGPRLRLATQGECIAEILRLRKALEDVCAMQFLGYHSFNGFIEDLKDIAREALK